MSAHSWERPLGSDADEGPPARRARHAWERIDDDDTDDHEAVPPLSEGDDDGDSLWGAYSDSEDGGEEPEAATPGKHILVSIITSGTNPIVLLSGENRLKS